MGLPSRSLRRRHGLFVVIIALLFSVTVAACDSTGNNEKQKEEPQEQSETFPKPPGRPPDT